MEICGDNRFEIIARAKADLLEGTNIETDEAEMAVIDSILFRCWQMGWLDRYEVAEQTEPQTDCAWRQAMFKKVIEVPLPYGMCERCKQFELTWSKLMADGQPYHIAYRCANEEFCTAIVNNIDRQPAE